MLFVDPFFLFVVLPVAMGAFYVARSFAGRDAALAVIVATSFIFYAPYGALAAALLITSLCVNLLVGIALSRRAEDKIRERQTLLTIGLLFNFAALGTFKYFDQIAALMAPSAGPVLGIAIPAGISFYTFHQAVFLLDAYKRQPEVMNFLKGAASIPGRLAAFTRYAAFVAFFPQLVIGPITYMSEFAPQVLRSGFGGLKIVNIQVGLTLVIVGLCKKLVVADNLASLVNPIFASTAGGLPVGANDALMAILGYSFQLYFDFSGYSDIALGIARLFGLRLPLNFDSPLRATGIVDFYRRWHITLTRVIALFVFTPISLWGTRFAAGRGYRGWRRRAFGAWAPFLLNFQIIALWHSAKFTFMAFGLIHGLWYVAEMEIRSSKTFKAFRSRSSDRFRTIAGMTFTVAPLMLTLALFRSESLASFWTLLLATVGIVPSPPLEVINPRGWLKIAGAAAIVYLLPNIYEMLRNYRPGIVTFDNQSMTPAFLRATWRPNLGWGLYVGALAILAVAYLNIPAPFLYAGF